MFPCIYNKTHYSERATCLLYAYKTVLNLWGFCIEYYKAQVLKDTGHTTCKDFKDFMFEKLAECLASN